MPGTMKPLESPSRFGCMLLATAALVRAAVAEDHSAAAPPPARGVVARLWTDAALRDWATPLANGLQPGHFSEAEYYAAPVDNTRTYDVYAPGLEPKGYWEWLHRQEPQPMIQPEKLRREADWIAAGEDVFKQLDVPALRSTNAQAIAFFRDPALFAKDPPQHSRDGIVPAFRWVIERRGEVQLSLSECASCHTRVLPDGRLLRGAPSQLKGAFHVVGILASKFNDLFASPDGKPLPQGEVNYILFGVPWLQEDVHARLKTMTPAEFGELGTSVHPSTFARPNGSPWFVTKFPDLHGVRDRPFFDHTATHRNRGPEDIARYAILVTRADDYSFGPYRMLPEHLRKVRRRFPDEAMLALGKYVHSLTPPKSPHPFNALARRGEKVFREEGCAKCHDPKQGYTNHKLTLAEGFVPPEDHPLKAHLMNRSVHTDPGLALKTRKGTGFYRVPSLRGVWYRGAFEHSGSVVTLEDWFDPRRLRDDYVPTGWKGPGVKARAVKGHEFGLDLTPEERAALIAFLKTL